jgi:hypothetical protein
MKVYFNEISVKGVKKWVGDDGKKHQLTKKFYQTVNPFNKNADGKVKTGAEIWTEILEERKKWLNTERKP